MFPSLLLLDNACRQKGLQALSSKSDCKQLHISTIVKLVIKSKPCMFMFHCVGPRGVKEGPQKFLASKYVIIYSNRICNHYSHSIRAVCKEIFYLLYHNYQL